ncbi:hypothetical protein C8J57DRAFT_1725104 [Mycena rebaudengoi]|nr:hypothetical protein C8J57DRAFT_1725104 [Mycena rebaudengoi]
MHVAPRFGLSGARPTRARLPLIAAINALARTARPPRTEEHTRCSLHAHTSGNGFSQYRQARLAQMNIDPRPPQTQLRSARPLQTIAYHRRHTSAIMRTLSERLADAGLLGGSFFFKRGHITRGNAQKLFSTLSYQLAHNIPRLRGPISKIVEDMPYLVAKSMNVQLQKLIMDPCVSLDASRPTTIIIDGLDECEGRLVQQEVLRLISTAVCERPLSLRFLIASRPEPHIREIFEASLFGRLHHTCNVEQSKEDVRKYLLDAFAQVVEHFVEKSSGYFIYAWTVIRFIDDKDFRPTEQLEALQDASHLGSPFSALDQLYVQILSTVPACHRLLPILRALEFFDFQLHISGIKQVLELKPGDVRLILRNLHSILHVPKPGDKPFIHTYHASFLDCLNDQSRSGQFYVGGLQHRVELGKSVLKALSYTFDNPEINLAVPVAFDVQLRNAIKKIPPLPEMIPLIRLISPDFFFHYFDSPRPILSLLENIGNPPEDLVQLWEDYSFMNSVQKMIHRVLTFTFPDDDNTGLSTEGFQPLSQCALLSHILQAYILGWGTEYLGKFGLCEIHLGLDISWADLRAASCHVPTAAYHRMCRSRKCAQAAFVGGTAPLSRNRY